MAGLIVLRPDVDWSASGGLFDWTLEFLIPRLSDDEAAARLQEIVDNNLGSLWISDFPAPVQRRILRELEDNLLAAAREDLPDTVAKQDVLAHLQELESLSRRVARQL
jgi:hypothetical protein